MYLMARDDVDGVGDWQTAPTSAFCTIYRVWKDTNPRYITQARVRA